MIMLKPTTVWPGCGECVFIDGKVCRKPSHLPKCDSGRVYKDVQKKPRKDQYK